LNAAGCEKGLKEGEEKKKGGSANGSFNQRGFFATGIEKVNGGLKIQRRPGIGLSHKSHGVGGGE